VPISLNHTIVPARDKEASAKFFADIFGLKYEGGTGHFAPVKVNDSLTMDFDNRDGFESHHYAFMVSDDEFDQILNRVKSAGLPYGSGPQAKQDMEINHRRGGRGFYFPDPSGHSLEVMTR
jgi:catechol 2,3-dioxygenase-like lactoylglutathione lyase family enzyme